MSSVPSNTTGGNVVRVTGYSGFASGAVYIADKRLELGLDNIEVAFLTTAVAAVAAFIWNYLKDRNVLGDNR